jgi:hypothetical protein
MTSTRPKVYDPAAMAGHDANDSPKRGAQAALSRRGVAVDPMHRSRRTLMTRFETIKLRGEWSALVLAECQFVAPNETDLTTPNIGALPTISEWPTLLERLLNAPADLVDYALLKYSDSGEVFRATLDWPGGSRPIVAKQSRPRGWLQRALGKAKFYFAPAALRARRNFQRALRLLDAGINTAIPLALIEHRGAPEAAWLVSEYIDGLVDLDHVALSLLSRVEDARQRAVRNQLIECVVALLVRLEQGGWYHRDLKASNILLNNWNEPTAQTWLLDLDGLRRRRPWEPSPDWRPLVRLVASLLHHDAITRTDFARFVQRFHVMAIGSNGGWKSAFCDIANRARTYRQQAASRRSTKLDGFGG